jgi:hypothetical protein
MVTLRYDPDSKMVRGKPDLFEEYECDSCGTVFTRKKFIETIVNTCSSSCSRVWKDYSKEKDRLMKLHFYRVKFPRDLEIIDMKKVLDNLSWVEMQVMYVLNNHRGKDIYWIIDKVFGTKYTEKGWISKRSAIYRALRRLIDRGRIRVYSNQPKGQRGCPRKKYVLREKVVTLDKECAYCDGDNFTVNEEMMKIKCLQCGLEWDIR